MIHELTQGSKRLFSSFFRSLLVKSLEDIQMPKSVIAERKAFFKKNWELEVNRLGEFTNYQIKLLAEASLLIELYGHVRFDIESKVWHKHVSEYSEYADGDNSEIHLLKELSFKQVQEFKRKQQGIFNFIKEFELAVYPPLLTVDKITGELVVHQRDVSNIDIQIKLGKVRLGLPSQLNQRFVGSLFEMLEEFNAKAVPEVSKSKKPSINTFFSKVLSELLPFIETLIIENDKFPSNTRFIAGLVFASFSRVKERSEYEDPQSKYKKGRGELSIDYYSYLAKTIRNFSTR